MADTIINQRNRMCLESLKHQKGCDVEFKMKGEKCFFTCGDIIGHVSPAVYEGVVNDSLPNEDIIYVQLNIDNQQEVDKLTGEPLVDSEGNPVLKWFSCLMRKSSNTIAVR